MIDFHTDGWALLVRAIAIYPQICDYGYLKPFVLMSKVMEQTYLQFSSSKRMTWYVGYKTWLLDARFSRDTLKKDIIINK